MGNIKRFVNMDVSGSEQIRSEINRNTPKTFMTLKAGRNQLRFCPVPEDFGHPPIVVVFEHGIEVDGKFVSFVCPRIHGGFPCAECEFEARLATSSNSLDAKMARSRAPRYRCFANAILRVPSDPAQELAQVIAFREKIYAPLEQIIQDYGPYTDLKTGYDIVITRPADTNGERDLVNPAQRGLATPLDPEGTWVEQLKNLKQFAAIMRYDEIAAAMDGRDPRKIEQETRRIGPGQQPRAAAALPRQANAGDDIDVVG